jgi:hypothetical protein
MTSMNKNMLFQKTVENKKEEKIVENKKDEETDDIYSNSKGSLNDSKSKIETVTNYNLSQSSNMSFDENEVEEEKIEDGIQIVNKNLISKNIK